MTRFHGPGPQVDPATIEQHRLTTRDWVEGRVKVGDKVWFSFEMDAPLEAATIVNIVDGIMLVLQVVPASPGDPTVDIHDLFFNEIDERPCLFAKWVRLG